MLRHFILVFLFLFFDGTVLTKDNALLIIIKDWTGVKYHIINKNTIETVDVKEGQYLSKLKDMMVLIDNQTVIYFQSNDTLFLENNFDNTQFSPQIIYANISNDTIYRVFRNNNGICVVNNDESGGWISAMNVNRKIVNTYIGSGYLIFNWNNAINKTEYIEYLSAINLEEKTEHVIDSIKITNKTNFGFSVNEHFSVSVFNNILDYIHRAENKSQWCSYDLTNLKLENVALKPRFITGIFRSGDHFLYSSAERGFYGNQVYDAISDSLVISSKNNLGYIIDVL
ncbi:MAG: hypothetical protein HUU10_14170 [Bacteroidetes bacterium]|nr:hypothetical protein [Bacteroidota bacterium]